MVVPFLFGPVLSRLVVLLDMLLRRFVCRQVHRFCLMFLWFVLFWSLFLCCWLLRLVSFCRFCSVSFRLCCCCFGLGLFCRILVANPFLWGGSVDRCPLWSSFTVVSEQCSLVLLSYSLYLFVFCFVCFLVCMFVGAGFDPPVSLTCWLHPCLRWSVVVLTG